MTYEAVLDLIAEQGIEIVELDAPERLKGLLLDEYIFVNKNLSTTEKKCILAEEYAHFMLNHGDILNQKNMNNRKQEKKARNFAYELLIPVEEFIDAFSDGCVNLYEVAEFFDVTDEFLSGAIEHYKCQYGEGLKVDRTYTIYFDPPSVLCQR